MPHAMQDEGAMRAQYAKKDGLRTRISLREKYSTNKQGFGSWIASHYRFPAGRRVPGLGRGTADAAGTPASAGRRNPPRALRPFALVRGDYVFFMTSIAGLKDLDRGALRGCFETRMDANGMLRILKEYGMFLCTR